MQAPKRKTSKSKRNMRRAHHALSANNTISCPQCGEPKLRHMICPSCGNYRGRAVVTVEEEV